MANYKNKKTGEMIVVASVISGSGWEEVTSPSASRSSDDETAEDKKPERKTRKKN